MLRRQSELRELLGEPSSRYNVSGKVAQIWRWPCSCLAIPIFDDHFQWMPCDVHRPTES
jgi:hypothetical protein